MADGMADQQQVQASRQGRNAENILVQAAVRQLKKPKVVSILGLWMFGLWACLFAPAPVAVTPEMVAKYHEGLRDADAMFGEQILDAQERYIFASGEVEAEKVWFWRLNSEARARVYPLMDKQTAAKRDLDAIMYQRQLKVIDARRNLGVWSEYGVDEARESFWGAFESGKVFAKRQTFWDMIFTATSSRNNDDGIVGKLIQWAFQAMINFTIGLIGSVFLFMCRLPGLLASFGAGWLSGGAFFLVAMVAAMSMVAAYLASMYGVAATGVYLVGKSISMQRVEGGAYGRRAPPRPIRYGGGYAGAPRPHYE